jgi:hypothetical protein
MRQKITQHFGETRKTENERNSAGTVTQEDSFRFVILNIRKTEESRENAKVLIITKSKSAT